METDLQIVDPADNTAAPAPSTAGSAARDLRAQLAKAIAVASAADDNAADAAAAAGRADSLLQEARGEVARLQAAREDAERVITERRASAISAALRAGEAPPAAPLPALVDSEPLASAMAALRAIEAATRELFAERDAARNETAAAGETVRVLADQILATEARDLANEWIAVTRLCWELQDRLTALVRLNGSLLPHHEQSRILEQVNRHKAAIAEDSLMVERHYFDSYLDKLAADQEKLWRDYGRRLMTDPDAVFDPKEPLQ